MLTLAQAFERAVACHQQGRLDEAGQLYRAVLRTDPSHFGSLHNLAWLATQSGRAGEALELLQRALAQQPDSTMAHITLGNALQVMGRFPEAIAVFERALAIDPNLPEAHHNCGNALLSAGSHREAVERYKRAIAIRPNYAEAYYHMGCALQGLDQHREAIACYERALALRPHYAEAHNNLGNALRSQGRAEEAVSRYEQALAITPDYAEAQINLAATLLLLNRAEEAATRAEAAIRIRPDFAEAHNMLGRALQALNRYREAIECHRRATAINPAYAEAHWYEGQGRLVLGDLAMGWTKWEHRLLMPTAHLPRFPRPQWSGKEDLAGKTVFLYAEPGEGFGDTIQFVRYVPLIARRGARVILEVHAALAPLLRGLEGVWALRTPGESRPDFDLHSPLMSLPFAFGTTMATIPAWLPYLSPSAEKVAEWRSALGAGNGAPRIGIAWSGRPRQGQFRNRAVPLQLLVPMLETPGFQFVAVQQELREGDAGILRPLGGVTNLGQRLADFSDTAAILSLLDLVITVDTSVAHLAAALGRPTWMMLQFSADWRWLMDRADSPWYPSARLFRQPAIGDWESVVAEVHLAFNAAFPAPSP